MNCPYCNHPDTRVVDSREVIDGVRRRRQCIICQARFTTYERTQAIHLFVVKKDKRREEFSRDKLLTGLYKACEKRPLPTGVVTKVAEDIESAIYDLGKIEISSAAIGEMVMERLKNLDYIAYIRFASVYREFEDITTLKKEVDYLVNDTNQTLNTTKQLQLLPYNDLNKLTRSSIRRAKKNRKVTRSL